MIAHRRARVGGQDIDVLSFDRPQRRNALLPEMLDTVRDSATATGGDAIVLTGEGPTFSAGFDLDACNDNPAVLEALLIGLDRLIHDLRELPKPVVMAVRGAAVAGGCALLAAADAVLATPSARFGYPVLRIGVSPAVSAPTLSTLIGPARAREMLLRPDLVSAEQARAIGLVRELVNDASLEKKAMARAAELASCPASARDATAVWLRRLEPALGHTDGGIDASRALVGSEEQLRMLAGALEARKNRP